MLGTYQCVARSEDSQLWRLCDCSLFQYKPTNRDHGQPMECLTVKKKKGKQATQSGILAQCMARHRHWQCDATLFLAVFFFHALHSSQPIPYPTFDEGRCSGWYEDFLLHHPEARNQQYSKDEQERNYKQLFAALDLQLSGHNLNAPRHMGAMELVACGASFEDIQQAGGWASVSVQRANYTKVPPKRPVEMLAGFTEGEEYCLPRNFVDPFQLAYMKPVISDLLGDLDRRLAGCVELNKRVGKNM